MGLAAAVSGKTLFTVSRAGRAIGGRIRIVLVADHISELSIDMCM
ncbi:hypothetical protein ACWCWD_02350 [Streptomyces sp. NPDC001493]